MNNIGIRAESTLHRKLKEYYAAPGDELEKKIGGYYIDIVRGNMLIEIQTGNFTGIRKKLKALLPSYQVKVVHPVYQTKYIERKDPSGRVLSRRLSPKKENIYKIFDELVAMPDLINEAHFTLELLLTNIEEMRVTDGKGSWRRKGVSIEDRDLISVNASIPLNHKNDFLTFLPFKKGDLFTVRELSDAAAIKIYEAGRAVYCLSRMGTIEKIGKKGRWYLYGLI